MFRGVHSLTVDAKGRMAIPARVRDRLSESGDSQVVVTVHPMDACLLVYPLGEWESLERKLGQLPTANPQNRRWQRLLVGYATECDPDSHGRILLPPMLRKYISLDKQVVMIGQVNHLEVWDESHWNQQQESWLQQGSELTPELEGLAL